VFANTGADIGGSQLTDRDDSCLEQDLPAVDSSVATTDCSVMDRRSGLQYSHMTAGVRYVTPVVSSLQTPFDGRMSARQHYNMSYNQNFHARDAGHFRPPSHVLNPMSGAHTVPEATPFQAIINPLESGYSMAAPRPHSWHVSPSRGQHGGLADTGGCGGKAPPFRRTPGARRPNIGGSLPVPHSSQPALVPRPLFQPSSIIRTGLSSGKHTSNATLPLRREFSENDLRILQSVSTASPYPASVKSRSSTESPRFDVTGGVELVVSNLDYNISSHEWKKILTSELQQQVQVQS